MHERLLHFEEAARLDGEDFTQKSRAILKRCGLECESNLVGQADDGASVMSGKHSGVETSIKEAAKQAF